MRWPSMVPFLRSHRSQYRWLLQFLSQLRLELNRLVDEVSVGNSVKLVKTHTVCNHFCSVFLFRYIIMLCPRSCTMFGVPPNAVAGSLLDLRSDAPLILNMIGQCKYLVGSQIPSTYPTKKSNSVSLQVFRCRQI